MTKQDAIAFQRALIDELGDKWKFRILEGLNDWYVVASDRRAWGAPVVMRSRDEKSWLASDEWHKKGDH